MKKMVVHMVSKPILKRALNNIEYVVQRKGGGSVVERPPTFSPDNKLLYLVWGNVVQAYSTLTGEIVRDYKGLSHQSVGVQLHPTRPELLISVSEIGEMMAWRWESGIHMFTINLKMPAECTRLTGFHLLPTGDGDCDIYATWQKRKGTQAKMSVFSSSGQHKTDLTFSFDNNIHSVAFAFGSHSGGPYVVAICKDKLYVIDLVRNKGNWLRVSGDRNLTCVACHPTNLCVATGDNTGRVLIWKDIIDNKSPPCCVYHWHTLPVSDVVFSQSGSFFYSGGGECVLVRWKLDSPKEKNFLPRMSGPVCHLVVSPENEFVAVSTLDNAIHLVNPQRRITKTIQYFSWGVQSAGGGLPLFPAGLNLDSRSRALVLNGRTGHIQFYDPLTRSLLYNLDITGQNYLTQERNTVIINTEVIRIALSSDGTWLGTVEHIDNGEMSVQVTLKFFEFNSTKQNYSLNTTIILPHQGRVHSLNFQPGDSSDGLLAVSTGADDKFRLWGLGPVNSIYRKGSTWNCVSVGYYRDLSVRDSAFSVDGSVMGVSFASVLTLWNPDKCELQHSLALPYSPIDRDHDIMFVEFGNKECCHLVVAGSNVAISVWNVLTLSIVWSVPLKLSVLARDPCSRYMAAFTKANDLFIFAPNNSQPILTKNDICPSDVSVLSAVFVPRSQPKGDDSWQSDSQLYFIDSNQELLALERADEVLERTDSGDGIPDWTPAVTPFSALIAQQTVTAVEQSSKSVHKQIGVPGKKELKELLLSPAHTMPPVHLLCRSLLRALVAGSESSGLKSDDDDEEDNDTELPMDTKQDSDDSEDEEMKNKPLAVSTKESENKAKEEEEALLTDPDLEKKLEPLLLENLDWVKEIL